MLDLITKMRRITFGLENLEWCVCLCAFSCVYAERQRPLVRGVCVLMCARARLCRKLIVCCAVNEFNGFSGRSCLCGCIINWAVVGSLFKHRTRQGNVPASFFFFFFFCQINTLCATLVELLNVLLVRQKKA